MTGKLNAQIVANFLRLFAKQIDVNREAELKTWTKTKPQLPR